MGESLSYYIYFSFRNISPSSCPQSPVLTVSGKKDGGVSDVKRVWREAKDVQIPVVLLEGRGAAVVRWSFFPGWGSGRVLCVQCTDTRLLLSL